MSIKNPKPADIYVGGRVRRARLAKGMSQEALGAAIGLTFQQVQKYEKGTNRIGSSRLVQIAAVFGASVAWFFEGFDPETGKAPVDALASFGTKGQDHDLAEAFLAIQDTEVRRLFVALMRAVAGCTNRQFHETKRRRAAA